MSIGLGQNTKESNGPPYLSLSYIEAPKPSARKIENQGRIDGLLSIINDPIQNINDQIFSTIEEDVILTNIAFSSVDIPLSNSNLDNDPSNVKGIYRTTDYPRLDNIIDDPDISYTLVDNRTIRLTEDIAGAFQDKGITEGKKLKIVVRSKPYTEVEKRDEITLDFHYLANQNFGFGLEKYFVQGSARKTIQQTKGDIVGDQVRNNFFVDTWGRGPDKIILSGVIEMPHGLDFACRFKNGLLVQPGRQNDPTENSFIGTLEEFYRNNNNPIRVNKGEILTLNDYFKGEFYIVTFKSRNFEQSVDRPNLMPWQIELIVLGKTDIGSYSDESLTNKGILNQLLNFGIS